MIRSRLIAGVVAAAALFATAMPAGAEKLIVSLSNHRVLVTSNFDGEELVLFGTIEPDAPRGALRAAYDIVVTVAGPASSVRTRRKERTLGIWINQEARQFINVPSYLAVLSNRPVQEITNEDQRRRLQIGLDNVILRQRVGSDIADTVPTDPFREAFVRLQTEHGVYRANPAGVTFLTPTVFRAAIPLPATTPTGNYAIDVKVFANGNMVVRSTSALEVVKSGFEQFVASAAHDYGLLYGLVAALMALATGWFASVVFRRD
ncbi:MAG: TIGR02186 family protein [Pseudolabrys sp.]